MARPCDSPGRGAGSLFVRPGLDLFRWTGPSVQRIDCPKVCERSGSLAPEFHVERGPSQRCGGWSRSTGRRGQARVPSARRLAERLGWRLLDTGAHVPRHDPGRAPRRHGPGDDQALGALAAASRSASHPGLVLLDGEDITAMVARGRGHPRLALPGRQSERAAANSSPGSASSPPRTTSLPKDATRARSSFPTPSASTS